MAEKKDEKEKIEVTPEEEENKKKKKKRMLIIILAVSTLALGGGAAFFLMGKKDSTQTATGSDAHGEQAEGGHAADKKAGDHGEKKADGHGDKKEGEHGEKKADAHGETAKGENKGELAPEPVGSSINVGATFTFAPFHLNLGNPLENRYIRLEVAVEYKNGPEQLKEIEARKPQLRDAVLSVISRKSREFLLGPDGKDQLRLEMLNKINQYMDRKIESVYITDMIIE